MFRRVFIVHGWGGYPDEGWFPWLKRELQKRNFKVKVPAMPNPEYPKIEEWLPFLKKIVGVPDEYTFFVGHSIGCQTILRYLETLPLDSKVGGVIFVAGWVNLMNISGPEEKEIARPWLEKPIRWGRVFSRTSNFVALFSDNDKYVPKTDSKIFKEKLGAKIIIEHNKGHFAGEDKVVKIPKVLENLLKWQGKAL